MQILQRTIQLELQPLVAIAGCQSLTKRRRTGGRLLRIGFAVDADIAHTVGITQCSKGVHVKECRRVECSIEHKHTKSIPVAVDILWSCGTCTSQLVISHHVRHGIAGGREIHVRHDATLVVLDIVVIEQSETLCE